VTVPVVEPVSTCSCPRDLNASGSSLGSAADGTQVLILIEEYPFDRLLLDSSL
jgi:hypothetical protein